MTERRQPWNRADYAAHRVRVQVLDPVTAFELEPQLIERFGDALALALAAPGQILGAVWSTVTGPELAHRSLADVLADPDPSMGLQLAADGVRVLTSVLSRAVAKATVDGPWLFEVWRRCVLGRLEVDGQRVETMRDWADLELRPLAKWHTLAAQLRQTYGPLWTRSPYKLRSSVQDFNVPRPQAVPIATQWAAMLAKSGQAPSAVEIVSTWTPVQLIEVVESAAMIAEREQRAYDAAMAASSSKRRR